MNTHTKRIVLGVLGLLVVLAAIYAIWMVSTTEKSGSQSIYRNSEYAYYFVYPPSYALEENTSDNVVLGERTKDGMDPAVEVTAIETAEGVQYTTFMSFAAEQASTLCGIDAPNVTSSCTGIASQEPFTASTALEGVMFYLTQVTRNTATGEEITGQKGPFYAFDISSVNPGTQYTMVLVRPSSLAPVDAIDLDFIRAIANSVQVIQKSP